MKGFESHPYIPNSVPEVQEEMLREIGLGSLEELHKNVPELLKLKNEMNLPKAFRSEYELKRHVERVLSKDTDCHRNLNFLGAGCWQHYVPAICDEINGKGEFLTAYGGEPYNDEGRFQSLFEYASMVAELVDMEVVNVPTMDWAQAAATTVRMAQRITNRSVVLVPEYIDAEKLKIMENYAESCLRFEKVKCDERGLIDLSDLKEKAGADTVGIYFENPGYLGVIEQNGQEISDIVHAAGGLSLVGIDPISLGVLATPASYGADIVCGDLQPLGTTAAASPALWRLEMKKNMLWNSRPVSLALPQRQSRESMALETWLMTGRHLDTTGSTAKNTLEPSRLFGALRQGFIWRPWARRAWKRWDRLSCPMRSMQPLR